MMREKRLEREAASRAAAEKRSAERAAEAEDRKSVV